MTKGNESPITARQPITDVTGWLDDLPSPADRALRALGELLVGVADRPPKNENAERFTTRCLGVRGYGAVIDEDRELNGVTRVTVALAVAELIDEHADVVELGPGEYADAPAWTQTEIGDHTYHHPQHLRAAFPAGTLLPGTPCVVRIVTRASALNSPEVTAFVAREHQAGARAVLDRLMERGNALHPYRGKACRASLDHGLRLQVIELPDSLTRETVVVDESVWYEIDLGVTAVRDRHELLNRHGLGARRGVLLVGPPGTGKSAVSAVIANELVGVFTVIYVEARAGAELLTAVVEEAQHLGGPVLMILEDVDLWCRDRRTGGSGGLSELLMAMDVDPDARILTLASTNDAQTLDAAAIRTGRFDSIVEVAYPDRAAAGRILSALIAGLPGRAGVDTAAVVARLPEMTSGSDLREIVRRAVLSTPDDGEISTAALLAEVGSGRYRAEPAVGHYL
ncbi:ATP-binding protein [Mycolicibacter sinensis]|uniref:Cell division protein n=1 Tax=Mycolicibacter sinensis (strain JDM601) TaxID=875328 RepID=A0A1A3U3S2_MYCSD|nr:ATP-binding protein [Mycolicibacter sinensis]OBK89534.1 cell division protein [Mycolicibacter sinensis]